MEKGGTDGMKKKTGMIVIAAAAFVILLAAILWLTSDRSDTVGICFRDSTCEENTAYRQQLKQELMQRGFEVISVDADLDQAKQLRQIAELAKKKCDVLLIEPVMESAAGELLTAIADAELPAVLFNRHIDTSLLMGYSQIAYIGMEETQTGFLQAQMMEALPAGGDLNGDGIVSYYMLCGQQDHQDAVIRVQSFEKALLDSELVVQQLACDSGNWTQESGRRLCKAQLAALGKDIEVIVCGNDQMASGAAQAIADGGRTVGKDIYLLAIGGEGDILNMIHDGKISGTVYSDPAVQINVIAQTVFEKFHQQSVEQIQILPYTTVTTKSK